jgi:predicted nucleotidyltransferase
MQAWLSEKLTIAQDVVEQLSKVPGIVGIGLGGSLARGQGKLDSDIDLGLYYEPDQKPNIPALRQLAAQLDNTGSSDTVTELGGWGPWINGGANVYISGHRMDWIYRDLSLVRDTVTQCAQGNIGRHARAGHPHGFHTHIYLGELHHNRILFDPAGALAELKARVTPYPKRLKEALIDTYSWQIDFALLISEKSVARAESPYVAGCFFESVYCMVQVLFALNEQHYVNEKGAIQEMHAFTLVPKSFTETVQEVLACPGGTAQQLHESLVRLRTLAAEVNHLVETKNRGEGKR